MIYPIRDHHRSVAGGDYWDVRVRGMGNRAYYARALYGNSGMSYQYWRTPRLNDMTACSHFADFGLRAAA